ncbi:hypothetical protein QQS21_009506 [Conoideocrella luteorostrata]|uniref:Uncharacterized protein n=1 Tax=Conoideocrella luteorostrata TaxID=1105319 RepID=A0AAJ0CHR7_9HYPO|nr:hypothetical protein QQS21_009506 [Conoideocrella luteorostrata]
MSQTSLVETSSGGPPRPAFENTGSLRLNLPYLTQEPSSAGVKQSFALDGRYIYETAATPATPIYHVSTSNTQSGKPWQLQVSRLLPSEARRLSVAASNAAEEPFIRYDDDLTLYAGEKINIPISIGPKPLLVIRGRKRGTVQGSIIMERSGRSYKFFHMIPIRRALTQAESDRMQALMHKRGYRDSDDWKKKLLLSVQERPTKGSEELEWIDEYDAIVATEQDGKVDIAREMEIEKRDLVIACWACKNFVLDKPA